MSEVTPFRIFCGWDSRQPEAAEVFAYSVRANSSIPVALEFVSADVVADKLQGRNCIRRGVTAFSFARFTVPHICGYEGRALFADAADQLCLGDVAELAALDMGGFAVMVVKHGWEAGPKYPRPRSWSSVMLMDCAKLRCWTPEAVETAPDDQLMRFGAFPEEVIGELPWQWNVLVQPSLIARTPDFGAAGHGPEYIEHGAKLIHWSHLSAPDGGSWIDRSGSELWAEWRERWRADARAA